MMRSTAALGADADAAETGVGVPIVLFFALASVGVLLVVAGVVPTAYAATGLTSVPLAFLIVGAVLVIFVPGYVAMTRYTPGGGAMYAIATAGFGRLVGVPVAFIALLAYLLLGVALYGIFGVQMSAFAAQHWNINQQWWFWALIMWAIVAVAGQIKMRDVGRFLGILALAEVVISVLLSVLGLAHHAPHQLFHSLNPSTLSWSALGPVLAIAVLGFIGFETTAVYAREARSPRRTVTIATYVCLLGSIVVYTLAAWAMDAHYGAATVSTAQNEGPGLFFGLGTDTESLVGNAFLLTSLTAALIAYHNGWVRYVYTASRAGMLPATLARTGTTGVARTASALQTVCGLLTIGATQLFHWNPLTQTFYIGGTAGGYGVLILLAVTSGAIVAFFRRSATAESRTQESRIQESLWTRLVLPGLAAVLLVATVVLATIHFALLIGVANNDSAAYVFPLLFLAAAVIGVVWALVVKSVSPDRYEALVPVTVPAPAAVADRAGEPAV